MADRLTFGGIGSGIDTESIISGLLQAGQQPIQKLQQRAALARSAVSTLSSVGTALSSLQTALDGLNSPQDITTNTAKSSGTQVAVSLSGNPSAGTYKLTDIVTAKAQKSYSSTVAVESAATALGDSYDGKTLTFKVGTGTEKTLTLTRDSTLNSIATWMNSQGLRASASVVHEGTNQYRLQVQGLDTGAANALTFSGTAADASFLDLAAASNGGKLVAATDASFKMDGLTITRPTNQITNVISGVSVALAQDYSDSAGITITVASDPNALKTKLGAMISSFNSVVGWVHTAAGFGQQKASNSILSGDSTLRNVESGLRSQLSVPVGTGKYNLLASIGVSYQRDGTLKLDETKLTAALNADPSSVIDLVTNRMDALKTAAGQMTALNSGSLELRKQALNSMVKRLDERATNEQTRLERQEELLRKQFTAMDQSVSSSQALMSQLTALSTMTTG